MRHRLADGPIGAGRADRAERQHGDRRPAGGQAACRAVHRVGGSRRRDDDRHLADEADAAAVQRADQALLASVVAQRPPGRLDPAGHRRVGHGPSVPDLLDDLLLGDHALGILDEKQQQGKDLRLHRDGLAVASQFALHGLEFERFEDVSHRPALRAA